MVTRCSFSVGAHARNAAANPLPAFVPAGRRVQYKHRGGAEHAANVLFGDVVLRCRHYNGDPAVKVGIPTYVISTSVAFVVANPPPQFDLLPLPSLVHMCR